ncbi:MAG: hypothetical protein JRF69_12465 [Deltaproteobacteria bacterium]|nr:hypothetical protein [Deltaproteobacteria bacterium]
MLTPPGLEEKARLTVNFLRRKMAEYEEIQRQIAELSQEVQEDRQNGFSQTETRRSRKESEYTDVSFRPKGEIL